MKEVEIAKVAMDLETNTPVVLLREKGGKEKFCIWMKLPQARIVAQMMRNSPICYLPANDLTGNLIKKCSGKIEKVVIDELKNDIYYAKISVRIGSKIFKIDAYPSDAIPLALKFKAPIYINEEKIAAREKPISDEEFWKFKEKLRSVSPEDFFNF